MMHISIVCVGTIKERYLSDGIAEYGKRLRPFARVEISEIREEHMPRKHATGMFSPSPAEREQAIGREGRRLLERVPKNCPLLALDLHGKEYTSEELAARLSALALEGRSEIAFLIGGAFGISEEVRKAAEERISLSRMTFTHQIARFLLMEQLYRAFKINRGEPYHC